MFVKRFFSMLLAVIITGSFISSCSEPLTLLDFISMTEDMGFGGYEFVIKGDSPTLWDPLSGSEGSSTARTVLDDAKIAHNERLSETYDFKIKTLSAKWEWAKDIAVDILSDSVDYDIIDSDARFMIDNVKAGYAIPWNRTEIDLKDYSKYGPVNYLRGAEYKGNSYGIWPVNRDNYKSYRGVVGVNNNLLGDFLDYRVYELYENGKWTYDEFHNILKLCQQDNTLYPLSFFGGGLFSLVSIFSNGGNLVGYDESSQKYYNGLLDKKAVKGLEFGQLLVNEGLVVEDSESKRHFVKDQKAVFYLAESYSIGGDIVNMDVICYPFGPDAEYGVNNSAHFNAGYRYFYMPQNSEINIIGKFVDIWFEEFEDLPKSSMVEQFKQENFFNEESADMFMYLSENAIYDYSFELWDVYSDYVNSMSRMLLKGGSITEFITSYEGLIRAEIDENLN